MNSSSGNWDRKEEWGNSTKSKGLVVHSANSDYTMWKFNGRPMIYNMKCPWANTDWKMNWNLQWKHSSVVAFLRLWYMKFGMSGFSKYIYCMDDFRSE